MTVRLTESDILRIWERGGSLHDIDRALLILSLGNPATPFEDLAGLPIGLRDRQLMEIYEATFGPVFEARDQCPHCGSDIEFQTPVQELTGGAAEPGAHKEIEIGGLTVQLRPIDSRALAVAAKCPDALEAELALLDNAVVALERGEASAIRIRDLPSDTRASLSVALEALDPNADIELEMICHACQSSWTKTLDIVPILWNEIAGRAWRLLVEIDILARSYGWTEETILALGPRRRAAYLSFGGMS